ncbi:MAG: hypothetical protein ACQESG_00655 [Nanobdellota archaeon]
MTLILLASLLLFVYYMPDPWPNDTQPELRDRLSKHIENTGETLILKDTKIEAEAGVPKKIHFAIRNAGENRCFRIEWA